MRYLFFLFFIFYSHVVSSNPESSPSCSNIVTTACTSNDYLPLEYGECRRFIGNDGKPAELVTPSLAPISCPSNYPITFSCASGCSCPDGKEMINGTCACPSGTQWSQYPSGGGSCEPISCPEGEIKNTVQTPQGNITSCIDEPVDNGGAGCDASEKVYDPVSGTMVCSGSGDGSSAASSQMCVVPGDFNGDCVPDDSSSPASTPASTPNASASNTSSPSTGGDDDGGDNGGGGGGGDDGGGNNTGGGSGSAAASSSPSGVNNSSGTVSSSSGQCDPTSKNYLSCISSQKITPAEGDIPWVPASGYGNWIPIAEDSPCPNKFKDATGSWWCSGGGSGGGANGSAASGGAAGSAASASGKCDNTAENYLACISGQLSSGGSAGSASSANASAVSSRSGAYSSLGEKGEFDDELTEKKLEDLTQELEDKIADIKEDISAQVGGTISGSGTIQDFCKNIRNAEVCFGLQKWEPFLDPISAAIFLVACVMAFSIVLRG